MSYRLLVSTILTIIIVYSFIFLIKDTRTEPMIKSQTHEYQMDVDEDSVHIYDNQRFVGSVPFKDNPSLDSLILKDNQ
jgi:hypothetical protein